MRMRSDALSSRIECPPRRDVRLYNVRRSELTRSVRVDWLCVIHDTQYHTEPDAEEELGNTLVSKGSTTCLGGHRAVTQNDVVQLAGCGFLRKEVHGAGLGHREFHLLVVSDRNADDSHRRVLAQ